MQGERDSTDDTSGADVESAPDSNAADLERAEQAPDSNAADLQRAKPVLAQKASKKIKKEERLSDSALEKALLNATGSLNDEVALFGQTMVAKLKTFPADVADDLQTEIMSLIARRRRELQSQILSSSSSSPSMCDLSPPSATNYASSTATWTPTHETRAPRGSFLPTPSSASQYDFSSPPPPTNYASSTATSTPTHETHNASSVLAYAMSMSGIDNAIQ